ncbi:MAG: hypothetical protein QXP22_02860 [Candidatus Anstonellales archaeon]
MEVAKGQGFFYSGLFYASTAIYFILLLMASYLSFSQAAVYGALSIIWTISFLLLVLINIVLLYLSYITVGFVKEEAITLLLGFFIYTIAYANFYFLNNPDFGYGLWLISNILLFVFVLRFINFMSNFNTSIFDLFNKTFYYYAAFMIIVSAFLLNYHVLPVSNILSLLFSFTIIYAIFLTFKHHEKNIYLLILIIMLNTLNDVLFYFLYDIGIFYAAMIDSIYLFVYGSFLAVFIYVALKLRIERQNNENNSNNSGQ